VDFIRFETELEFSEETVPDTPAGSVFKALTGKKFPKKGKPGEPGVRMRDEKEKTLVLWQYNYCSVLLEDEKDKNRCINRTIDILGKIDNSSKIGMLKSSSLITYWILPVKGVDFKELELKFRESFYKEAEIFNNCVDSSVFIDIEQENSIMHHQSGAMGIEQLTNDYRAFKFTGYEEKLFIFLLARMLNTSVIKYSKEGMRNFLSWSFEKSYNHAEIFGRITDVIFDRYVSEIVNEYADSSVFYNFTRFLSALIVFIFFALLISSIVIGGPVHWAVAIVGCLGSIGFAGAVWLSKSIVEGKDV